MRIPRKSGEAVIVLGGKSGAFWFGFWAAFGAFLGLNMVSSIDAVVRSGVAWVFAAVAGWVA